MNEINELSKRVFDKLSEGVYCTDRARSIIYWSKGAERITGFRATEVIGTHCYDNILNHLDEKGDKLCHTGCPLETSMRNDRDIEARIFIHHRDGHRIPVRVHITPIRDDSGAVTGAIETFTDISADVAALERINRLREVALLDPLTRLGNRRYTESALGERLDETRRYSWSSLGVLFVDIDDFKRINDTHGHESGDKALQVVAGTLLKSMRSFDFLGRWGGDEFVILAVNVRENQLRLVAERLCRLVEQSVLKLPGARERMTVSVGATLARTGETPRSVIRRADALMYRSKQAGGNRVTVDEEQAEETSEKTAQQEMEP
jgi:diguanylate cyclase (GGDEF)-like protein/PAS domain S-box-containing protein